MWVTKLPLRKNDVNQLDCKWQPNARKLVYVDGPFRHRCSIHATAQTNWSVTKLKKAHTRLPSVGFRSWSWFLTVTPQVTWVINPAVGCHYFLPGLQLPRNPKEGCYQFRCLVNRGTLGMNSLPKTVTRQHHDCYLNPGLLLLSPAR